ncbi:MAG: prolyl oligopeptidase family serine peptidase [Cyanobacteria bacterium REEB67]|nr:prolyl oligopeptidase family serine peptidase [Cyanobacteria bacterium REEB67]
MRRIFQASIASVALALVVLPARTESSDPYLWLEEVSGRRALAWVQKENSITKAKLASQPIFSSIDKRILKILDSKDKVPYVSKHGRFYYNYWRDDKNVRGVWRRTTLEEYKKVSPDWEVLIDLDKLAAAEKENWNWSSVDILYHDYDLALVSLSRGGGDATVVREFDLHKKQFVKDGFNLPEAKSSVAWRDRNSLYVGTDFGPGSMTTSGYPRLVKEWKRGQPLKDARQLFEGQTGDVGVDAFVDHDHGYAYDLIERKPTFFSNQVYLRRGTDLIKIDKPDDAMLSCYGANVLFTLRKEWKIAKSETNGLKSDQTFKGGSLLIGNFEDYLKGRRDLTAIFEPSAKKCLEGGSSTKNFYIINELDNVVTHSYLLQSKNGAWQKSEIETPPFSSTHLSGVDADLSDDYWMTSSNLLTPGSLYIGEAGTNARTLLKRQPSFFNSDNLDIKQFEAHSDDGTIVPYFQLSRKDLKLNGTNPTLLYGYGGFEISLLPKYDAINGASWAERGGVYILANIRGGGEFGPAWHEAARKNNRQRAYEDFSAIARDLIARKVTSPKHLGIDGRSNGGLLMGVMLTRYPELFGAVHCGSPLLDMKRFNHLLAGASWMDEYGDPDKESDWSYISKYSPYQNVSREKKYPPILITTATSDDRVHPGHARKMAARLQELGHEVLFYENTEGGHGAASNNKQTAFMNALAYTFLWDKLR